MVGARDHRKMSEIRATLAQVYPFTKNEHSYSYAFHTSDRHGITNKLVRCSCAYALFRDGPLEKFKQASN